MPQKIIYYLHGFNSSPSSHKALFFKEKLQDNKIFKLRRFNLNQSQEKFAQLTLSRQIFQVEKALKKERQRVYLVGSSFGGLTCAWLSHRNPDKVAQMVLLAPAFAFAKQLRGHLLGRKEIALWRKKKKRLIEHAAYGNKTLPLRYGFYNDLLKWPDRLIRVRHETKIYYGKKDEVILPQEVESFAERQPLVSLVKLNDDHSLTMSIEKVYSGTLRFFQQKFSTQLK